jgi:hypothetical protein
MKKKAILFMLVLIFISTNALSQNWIQGQLFFTGPQDVSVEIYRVSCGSDVLVDTYTTKAGGQGYYGFGCLANGLYRVVPDNSWVFDPEFGTVQIPRAEIRSYNFYPTARLTPYGISGTVSGDVQEGVTITLSALTSHTSATTTTASDGTYNFTELFTGAYTITPCMSSYAFDPESELVSPFGISDVTGVDFTATSTP